jgi:catechol 2,3-dioxygenase-like lactoylglutathione lyase family enzyme
MNVDKIPMIMTRVILYVRNVELLKDFYQTYFDAPVVEEIKGEWVVLKAGEVELALHLVGPEYRREESSEASGADEPGAVEQGGNGGMASNAKLVFTVKSGLPELRDRLLAAGVKMRSLKRYAGFAQLMCDGEDPEGNVFQLSQPD